MKALRALIVDDEEAARGRLRHMLLDVGDIEIVGEAADGREALEKIPALRPDLLFLDVQMPRLTGFDVVTSLGPEERPPAVIFVTAYDKYALRAFEVSALDYLLKPYDATRLNESVRRARERLLGVAPSAPDPRLDRLLQILSDRRNLERLSFRSGDGIEFINVSDIDWLESEGNYTVLHSGNAEVRVRETLSDLVGRLESAGFIRIHRSIAVNCDRIFRLEPWAHGEYVVILRNGTRLRSGRTYSEELARFLP